MQYDPTSRFFEVHEGTLLFSGDNGVPLIRYHIADTGGVISYEKMLQFLHDWGFDPLAILKADRGIHALPFVYVFGRFRQGDPDYFPIGVKHRYTRWRSLPNGESSP